MNQCVPAGRAILARVHVRARARNGTMDQARGLRSVARAGPLGKGQCARIGLTRRLP